MCLNTLDINTARVNYAIKKKAVDKSDGRVRAISINKTAEEEVEFVKAHISKFPRHISHYCRHTSTKEYLGGVACIADMYRLYKDDCLANKVKPVSDSIYRRIINSQFNLSFDMPKSDTCKKFDIFSVRVKTENGNLESIERERVMRT